MPDWDAGMTVATVAGCPACFSHFFADRDAGVAMRTGNCGSARSAA